MVRRSGVVGVVAVAIACLLTCGLAIQAATVLRVSAFHLRGHGGANKTELFAGVAKRFPTTARFAATSYFGRIYMRYAAYPRTDVTIQFAGASESQIRAALQARNVRYVVVTAPGAPVALRGRKSWYRVVYLSNDGTVRLLEITG